VDFRPMVPRLGPTTNQIGGTGDCPSEMCSRQ